MLDKSDNDLPGASASSIYSLQDCADCKSTGRTKMGCCATCNGEGSILVVECPRCCGSGTERSQSPEEMRTCAICAGTGWTKMLRASNNH